MGEGGGRRGISQLLDGPGSYLGSGSGGEVTQTGSGGEVTQSGGGGRR